MSFIRHQWFGAAYPVLPRRATQVADAMRQWGQRLANPDQYLQPPAGQARATLKQIRAEMAALKARRGMLGQYAAKLQKALADHEQTTRPVAEASKAK